MRIGALAQTSTPTLLMGGELPLSNAQIAAMQGHPEDLGGASEYVAPYQPLDLTWGYQTPVWYQDPITGQWRQVPQPETTAWNAAMYPNVTYPGLNGIGDAVCPSLEQLQGITDINDPCQSSGLPIFSTGAENAVTALNTPYPMPPTQAPGGVLATITSNLPLILGAGLVILLLTGRGRR